MCAPGDGAVVQFNSQILIGGDLIEVMQAVIRLPADVWRHISRWGHLCGRGCCTAFGAFRRLWLCLRDCLSSGLLLVIILWDRMQVLARIESARPPSFNCVSVCKDYILLNYCRVFESHLLHIHTWTRVSSYRAGQIRKGASIFQYLYGSY